jgi:hypothetical protein
MKAETKAGIMALSAFILVAAALFATIGIPYASEGMSSAVTSRNINFTIIIAAIGAAVLAYSAGSKSE